MEQHLAVLGLVIIVVMALLRLLLPRNHFCLEWSSSLPSLASLSRVAEGSSIWIPVNSFSMTG